jgi:hypothetical protein
MKHRPTFSAALALLAILPISAAHAQDKTDANVLAMLRQSTAAYRALDSFLLKLTAKTTGDVKDLGDIPEAVEIRYQKPNKVFVSAAVRSPEGKVKRELIVSDGVSLWRWKSGTNQYTKSKAPATFTAFQDMPSFAPELEVLFRSRDPFEGFPGPGGKVTLGAPTTKGDVEVDVIEVTMPADGSGLSGTIHIFLGRKDHLFHGLMIAASGQDRKTNKPASLTAELIYDVLNAKPTFTAADFKFTAPPGSKQVTQKTARFR